MDGPVFCKKSCKINRKVNFLKWIGTLTSFIAKTVSKKIGDLICSMKFLSSDIALTLCKPTNQSCLEYTFHACDGALHCFLEMLDKLEK